uniref:Metallophosphoesterase 1 n=1 Tax=Chelonoidis abingdonii TaxID=106734 RepID=A0A8C0G0P7_CHEAB
MKEGALPLGNNFSMRSDLGTMKILHLKKRGCFLLKLLCLVVLMLIFCEFLVYYVVILQCHWPEVKIEALRSSRQSSASVLKAMFLSDTHLLGEIKGHWLDKLRREWQMERAFQTALSLLEPDIVFILGDVFDEGKWSSSQAWADDVRRFQKMFRHPVRTELMVVVGNHDIGFHYEMTPYKLKRFAKVFNFTSGKLIIRKGVNFVMVNSVALDGDGCTICSRAEAKLMKLSHKLNCSQQLLWWFHPRLILSGHTHSACEVLHNGKIPEISVPSFSWRNRNNPSFIMGSITPTDFSLYKCFLPLESRVVTIYCIAGALLGVLILAHLQLFNPPFYFAQHLIRKHKAV